MFACRRPTICAALLAHVLLAGACDGDVEALPPDKLAKVGDVLIGPEELAHAGAQLGPYGQLRFRGGEGRANLLQALVEAELLAREAIARGLEDDPRVRFAVLEEIAALARNAAMEREVPHDEVAADEAALRAYYEAHPEEFTVPERRNVQGVLMKQFEAAEEALERLRLGVVQLDELGEPITTKMQARDDEAFPAFHAFMFAEGVGAGDWLPHPVVVGERLLVGRVRYVEPSHVAPFEDPEVQEKLVHAVRAPLLKAAEERALAALRAEFPEIPQSSAD